MKKTIISTALILMMSLLLNGCFGYYSIKVVSGKDYMDKCPKRAKPGQTVTITTVVVTDANLYVNSNDDTEIKKISEGVYEFIMPEHDIELKITIISNNKA